ncbi:uncharacterized protein LOC117172072 [Belonocnema kinseyi]|uniref:uncharacterized protein LOC117172072 n=1 Tax=Belonocnema kinseyi TaxID=2817044 RepID=UPI00143D6B7A|nr:uncharacterized protein LOC117172072 [Belonocnema kinseyi]
MKIVIGFIFLVSPCWFGHYNSREIKQIIEIDKEVINQEPGFKQIHALNSTTVSTGQISATKLGPCYCAGGLCACCSRLLFNAWKQKACVNVTYDPDEFSFTTKILMNDRILYMRTISGKNPRPVCVPIPRFPLVRVCVRFYNIYFQGKNIHTCISIEGKFRDTSLFTVGLDCLRFGTKGVAIVKPEDGGGLGQVEFLPSDNTEDENEYYDENDYDDEDEDDLHGDDEDDLFNYDIQ